MDQLLKPEAWPLWFCLAVTLALATINCRTLSIPNAIVFPFMLGGIVLGAARMGGVPLGDNGIGTVFHALATTVLALGMLLPLWFNGLVGAGTLKLQMAQGSWLGAYYGIVMGSSAIIWATLFASVLMGLLIMKARGAEGEHRPVATAPAQLIGLVIAVVGLATRVLPVLMG